MQGPLGGLWCPGPPSLETPAALNLSVQRWTGSCTTWGEGEVCKSCSQGNRFALWVIVNACWNVRFMWERGLSASFKRGCGWQDAQRFRVSACSWKSQHSHPSQRNSISWGWVKVSYRECAHPQPPDSKPQRWWGQKVTAPPTNCSTLASLLRRRLGAWMSLLYQACWKG